MSVQQDADDQRRHSVYRCFDAEGQLLYIGCAQEPTYRMHMHMQTSTQSAVSWELQERMARWDSVEYPTKAEARAAERAAILAERPLLNRQHNPTRWRKLGGRWTEVA